MADPTAGLIVYADGPDGPLPDPVAVARLAGTGAAPVRLLTGWVVRTPGWLADTGVPVTTLMLGTGLRRAAADGRVCAVATRLSAIPGLLAGRLRPDVAVVGARRGPDGWYLAGGPGMALAAARSARAVVVEHWPGPPAPGAPPLGPAVEGRVVAEMDRTEPADPPPEHRLTDAHHRIGRLIAGLVPAGATIQWGPGAVGAAVIDALDQPVAVRSGLVTDELVGLAGRGLLVGRAVAAYAWGGPALRELAATGRLELREIAHTHDVTALSGIRRFVAVNTALQVGLDGAANVETVEGRAVSGPGGHPDFAMAAARSPGGLSIVALPATAGGRSTIVARPDVVSTPRSDVDVVVTEHGVADLRDADDVTRRERLIAVAAPEHRDSLRSGGAPVAAG